MYSNTVASGSTTPAHDVKLTPKEWDFIELLAKGLTNKAIADKFFLVEHTIQDRSRTVYAKLGLTHKNGISPRVMATLWYWGLNGVRDVKQS